MVSFQLLNSLSNLFCIKSISLLLQNVFSIDQYVLELLEGLDYVLVNIL